MCCGIFQSLSTSTPCTGTLVEHTMGEKQQGRTCMTLECSLNKSAMSAHSPVNLGMFRGAVFQTLLLIAALGLF